MGRARFLFYPVFFFFFFRRFVGDQTQTSLGQTSNDATYDIYASKAVKTLIYCLQQGGGGQDGVDTCEHYVK